MYFFFLWPALSYLGAAGSSLGYALLTLSEFFSLCYDIISVFLSDITQNLLKLELYPLAQESRSIFSKIVNAPPRSSRLPFGLLRPYKRPDRSLFPFFHPSYLPPQARARTTVATLTSSPPELTIAVRARRGDLQPWFRRTGDQTSASSPPFRSVSNRKIHSPLRFLASSS